MLQGSHLAVAAAGPHTHISNNHHITRSSRTSNATSLAPHIWATYISNNTLVLADDRCMLACMHASTE
jgi:hypothetical protein